MKAGFVNIFGLPNAGKSTLLNALIGEKLAIVSPKVQTTRHRIKGILTTAEYQIIISDTPGIIQPKYKLHEKMMMAVKGALEDADVALLLIDATEDPTSADEIFQSLNLTVPSILVINKGDSVSSDTIKSLEDYFFTKAYCKETITISALKKSNIDLLIQTILKYLPNGEPFFDPEEMTDLPMRFFVGEMVREKIFQLYKEEIPYHTTVFVSEYKEKSTLIKITANIIVQRETQKGILLGEGGKMIRQLGTEARKEIEAFVGQKVFLELFVKVKPKWRDSDFMLREYGYN